MTCDSQGKGFMFANYWPAANMQGQYDKNVFPEGSKMQDRKLVRRAPFGETVHSLTEEAQQVIDSIPDDGIAAKITAELEGGRAVTLEYKPAPGGSLKYTLESGMSGKCSV